MGFPSEVWASLSWKNTCILEGILGWHRSKCIQPTLSFLMYLAPWGMHSCPERHPDVGSLTRSWKAACTWKGRMAGCISSVAIHFAARLCCSIRVSVSIPLVAASLWQSGSLRGCAPAEGKCEMCCPTGNHSHFMWTTQFKGESTINPLWLRAGNLGHSPD